MRQKGKLLVLGMVVFTCNPSTQKGEARESQSDASLGFGAIS